MIRILGTVFAGLLGLAFGSFLNVCVSRWPAGESVAHPRSHCRSCGRTLAWWENLPLISWLALRGHCRSCKAKIGWRYLAVELAVGALSAAAAWQVLDPSVLGPLLSAHSHPVAIYIAVSTGTGNFILYWLLIALAVLDAEHLWLPDSITLPGAFVGFLFVLVRGTMIAESGSMKYGAERTALRSVVGILAAAGLILIIRWVYWLIRRREGIGLGDAKLMALLAAWLGLPGALVAFALGVVLGAAAAIAVLAVPSTRKRGEVWALTKLPLGTFLCMGGIISGLCGQQILAGYLHWAGF